MRARARIRERNLLHPLHTRLVIDHLGLRLLLRLGEVLERAQLAAVPVRGVLAQADVARDDDGGELAPDQLGREDDGRLGVVGERAAGVLLPDDGDAEEDDGAETFRDERRQEPLQAVDAPPLLPWKRLDFDLSAAE